MKFDPTTVRWRMGKLNAYVTYGFSLKESAAFLHLHLSGHQLSTEPLKT